LGSGFAPEALELPNAKARDAARALICEAERRIYMILVLFELVLTFVGKLTAAIVIRTSDD
jgi:hypothetical protein